MRESVLVFERALLAGLVDVQAHIASAIDLTNPTRPQRAEHFVSAEASSWCET